MRHTFGSHITCAHIRSNEITFAAASSLLRVRCENGLRERLGRGLGGHLTINIEAQVTLRTMTFTCSLAFYFDNHSFIHFLFLF